MRKKTQSRSHIPISEGRLLLRCLWKAGLTLQSKTGNHSPTQLIWGARKFPQVALLKLMILFIESVFSGNLSSFLKGVRPLVLYDEDRGMVMEPMQGKLASSQFDLGHSDLLCIPEVTSVIFSVCHSVVGNSLEFNQANRGS